MVQTPAIVKSLEITPCEVPLAVGQPDLFGEIPPSSLWACTGASASAHFTCVTHCIATLDA